MAPGSPTHELRTLPPFSERDAAVPASALTSAAEQPDSNTEIEQQPLAPADEGRLAWLMLAACCIIQIPVWGFSLAFGVFQEYYSNQDEIKGDKGNIAVIGTTSTGILYLLSPITFTFLTRYPRLRRYCGPVGLLLTLAGFLLSSFASHIWQLIATQGILCAVGNGLLFSPTTLYLDQWFLQRKGLAYGIMWAAKSVAGVALPFLANVCLDRFGWRTTLRAWTVVTLFTTLPILQFLKPRIPPSPSTSARRLDLTFLKLITFWMLQLGNIIQSFGYFLPTSYLPSYASTLGLSKTTGTLMVSLFNATSVFGGIVLGILCDKFAVTHVTLFSSLGSALSVFLFWGLSTTSSPSHSSGVALALLALFSVSYGFFAGGFSSTWSGVLTQMKRESPRLETGLVFGALAGGRGIGNVISGPLSTVLIQHGGQIGRSGGGFGYVTEYGSLILFTGLTALFGAWGWMWKYLSSGCRAC